MRSRSSFALVAWIAVSLGAAPMGVSGAPQTPPPLPPDTVDQLGLSWDLTVIGKDAPTKPFRYSLCLGRYLLPGEGLARATGHAT